jgi:hypothetical protein
MPERERKNMMERFIPIVEGLMRSPEGMRDIAAICSFYMQEHKPETSVPADRAPEPPPESTSDAPEPERSPRRNRSRGKRGGGRDGGRRNR